MPEPLFNKAAGLRPATLSKEFCKTFKNTFFTEHSLLGDCFCFVFFNMKNKFISFPVFMMLTTQHPCPGFDPLQLVCN